MLKNFLYRLIAVLSDFLRFYCLDVVPASVRMMTEKIFGLFINCRKDGLSRPSDFKMSAALGSVSVHQKNDKLKTK